MRYFLTALLIALVVASSAFAGSASPPGLLPGLNLHDVPATCAARTNLAGEPSYSTVDRNCGWNAAADAKRAVLVACFQNSGAFCGVQAANVISFPKSGTLTTTVTANLDGNTVTLGSHFCASEMAGQPISIPTAGVNGGTYSGTIVGCIGSQATGGSFAIGVEPPLGANPGGASLTVTYGANFSAADVGKSIMAGFWQGNPGGSVLTISAVNSPTNITVSGNTTTVLNNAAATFVWGTDDSAAVNAAISATLAAGYRFLEVPADHFVPSLAYTSWMVLPRGVGRFLSTDASMPVTQSTPGSVIQHVIPWTAPSPSSPLRTVVGQRDFPQLRAVFPSPNIVATYDSLETWMPNQVSMMFGYSGTLKSKLARDNRPWAGSVKNCSIGGATYLNLDGNPNATQAGTGNCLTSTGSSWLSQITSFTTPHLVSIGGGNNDGNALTPSPIADFDAKLAALSPVPDRLFLTHHHTSQVNATTAGNLQGSEYAAGFIESFAAVMHYGYIDVAREAYKNVQGYDPLAMRLVRRYDIPYNPNVLALPYTAPFFIEGFATQLTKSGQVGATFWNNFTANGGISDPRGPIIGITVGTNADNRIWLIYKSGDTTVKIECDPSAELPGMGCDDPATGLPPVTPTKQTNVTVANSGAGGVAVVTTSAALLAAPTCVVGNKLTVPAAGPTLTPPGSSAYTAPLISVIASCDSSTQITLSDAASNIFAARSGFVLFGDPAIITGTVDTSATNEALGFEVMGDQLVAWVGDQYHHIYKGPVWRSRSAFQPKIISGGNRPSVTIASDPNGFTTFLAARPNLVQAMYRDQDVSGPPANTPVSNTTYVGAESGDGANHYTTGFANNVIRAAIEAQDFYVGQSGAGTTVPTTGFSLTVPDGKCFYGLAPAGTLATGTITLSANFDAACPLTIASTQTITALTVAAPTGYSLSGASVTTLAANGSLVYRRDDTNKTFYRVQ